MFNYLISNWNNNLSFPKNIFRLLKRIIIDFFSALSEAEKLLPNFLNKYNPLKFSDINVFSEKSFPTPKLITSILDSICLVFNFITLDFIWLSFFFVIVLNWIIFKFKSVAGLLLISTVSNKIIVYTSSDFDMRRVAVIYCHFIVFMLSYLHWPSLFIFLSEYFFIVLVALITLKLFQLVFIPTKLLYKMGFFYIVYVKGSGVSKVIAWEYVTDAMSMLSFYLRSLIQLVRLVIIIALLFTYHELYEQYNFFNGLNVFFDDSVGNLNFFHNTVSFLIKFTTYWLYECVHFIILFCVQYSAFSLILFNLISFLYLQKLEGSLEGFVGKSNFFTNK